VSFKFFADNSEARRSPRTLDGVPASLEPEPLLSIPLNEIHGETSPAEFDALSLFRPEDPAVGPDSHHAFPRTSQLSPRFGPGQDILRVSAAPRLDSTPLDNLRALVRQMEIALAQSKSDADAVRLDVSQLREGAAQLAQEHARLRDACCQMEERTGIAVAALKALENRVGSLETRSLTKINSTVGRTEPASVAPGADVLGHIKRRGAAILATLAALILLGLVAMRSRQPPIPIAERARAPRPQLPVSASVSALPGGTLGTTGVLVPTNQPAQTLITMPAGESQAAADPAKSSVGHSTAAGMDVRGASRGASTRTARVAEYSRPAKSARDANQQFVGGLQIESVPPGAAVFLNQQHVGETPLQMTRLRAGSHVIRIEHDGYERWTTDVTVPADKQTRVSATLKRVRDR